MRQYSTIPFNSHAMQAFSHLQQGPDDLSPIACTSGSFSNMQQGWSSTEEEVFAIYQSVLRIDLYLRTAQCIIFCDHKPLEPFLSCGMKIPKLNHWSMELSDYNLMFIHIKGRNNILAGEISRLKTLYIYKNSLEHPKTYDTMT